MTEPVYGEYLLRPKVVGQVAVVRRELGLNSTELVGIQISDGTALIDPTDITAMVYKRDEDTSPDNALGLLAITFNVSSLNRESAGIYSFIIPNFLTNARGQINVVWSYQVNSKEFTHKEFYAVTEEMPHFSALTPTEKTVIDGALFRFADLYDSFDGGPHLKEEFQTHFSKERVAGLLRVAVSTLNYQGQPLTTYFVGPSTGGQRFPVKHYGILEWALFLEIIRYLIRSYTEQPVMQGSPGVVYEDRRDYTNRWREVLRDEEVRFNAAVGLYKRAMFNLGGGSLLVSGGIFGQTGMWSNANGYMTAALRGFSRNYPISYVVSSGF